MANKDSNSVKPWFVPIAVAVIGALSTVVVAWINKRPSNSPVSQKSPASSIEQSQEENPDPSFPVAGSPEQPIRLLPDQIKALLVGKIETGRVIEPSIASLEGNSNTWYDAYYYGDNTMLYRRAASESGSEKWMWFIEKNGSLCRGPGPTKAEMFCRSVESVGNDTYRGVGFRSGKPRYEFTLKSGNADELQ